MSLDKSTWADGPERCFAGVSLGRSNGRLKIALLHCEGDGWNLRMQASDSLSLPRGDEPLAQRISTAFSEICQRAEMPKDAVDVLGLMDVPEVEESRIAAMIADQTGVTTVSGFQHQDIAVGGRGGPFGPVPNWFLHRSGRQGRLLVDLGPTLRVTYLAPGGHPHDTLCFDVGPCCRFLDHLMRELSKDRYPFDPSGHFAVQGKCCESLIGQWISHPFLLKAPPRFLSDDAMTDGFLENSLAFAREQKLTAADVLCSANHFVIRNLREAAHRFLAVEKMDEIRVCGGGVWNGLLWKLLGDVFRGKPVFRIDDLGIPSETRRAVHAAILAYCAIEHLPANIPNLTGARRPRVLGQITPGNEDNWDRCVINLADRFDIRQDAA